MPDYKKEVDWSASKEDYLESKARNYRILSAVLAFVCIFQSIANVAMFPLKTTEIKYIRIDGMSGIVDTYSKLDVINMKLPEIIIENSVKTFVRWREEYIFDLQSNRDFANAIMSTPTENAKYQAYVSMSNPVSPINLYKEDAVIKVIFKTATKLADNGKSSTWQVRFIKNVDWKTANRPPDITHHMSTVTFYYDGSSLLDSEREINPLGFLATNYVSVIEGTTKPGVMK